MSQITSESGKKATLECSIGIMAHNEEANIGRLLGALRSQRTAGSEIAEIVVVASGCTDATVPIVREAIAEDSRIRLLVQERREGKASAINLFMTHARYPILVLLGGDLLPESDAIEALTRPFEDPGVGMTGGRPVPLDDPATLLGYTVHLQWRLHDRVALHKPKLGEMIAFRNVVRRIDPETAVDEVSLESAIVGLGYRLAYVPEAVVYNHGPTTLRDYLRQRRRIHAGHLNVKSLGDYDAATLDYRLILSALAQEITFSPSGLMRIGAAIGLEALGRVLGRYDFSRRRDHRIWEVVSSTKRVLPSGHRLRHRPVNQVVVTVQLEARGQEEGADPSPATDSLVEEMVSSITAKVRAEDRVVAYPSEGVILVTALTTAQGTAVLRGRIAELAKDVIVSSPDLSDNTRLEIALLAMPLDEVSSPELPLVGGEKSAVSA